MLFIQDMLYKEHLKFEDSWFAGAFVIISTRLAKEKDKMK